MVVNGASVLIGGGVFALSCLLHILLWAKGPVKKQLFVLIVIFLVLPTFFYLGLWTTGSFYLSSVILTFFLGVNYISVYPAVQASSPTLVILDELYRRKELSEIEIHALFNRGKLIQDRIEDLEKGGMITMHGGQFRLSKKADWLARFFILYRDLLKLPVGAG